jgi:hypothetical protein
MADITPMVSGRTSAADLRAAADRIERDAPAWAKRMHREADQMDAAYAGRASGDGQ